MPNLKLTLKAWPVITLVTIGLCFLTQQVGKLFGIDLPDQDNLEIVRRCAQNAFVSLRGFGVFAILVAQIVIVMPALEELLFRGLLFKLPVWLKNKARKTNEGKAVLISVASISSALFSAAHYLFQSWPDAAFLALFFFGIAQCGLYKRTNRIWCPMLNHALFNLTNLILLFFMPE